MNNPQRVSSHRKAPVLAAALSLTLMGFSASAAVQIPQTPLQSALSVPPNVLLSIDDSGSMDSEILLPTNDGALWWRNRATGPGARSFVGRGRDNTLVPGAPNYNGPGAANADWKKYVYLFPNGTGAGNRVYNDGTNDHYAVPPLPEYAFTRSGQYNLTYYDPAIEYRPWVSRGTQTFGNADITAARSDPTVANSAVLDLTTSVNSSTAGWQFAVHEGMRTSAGTNARRTGGREQRTFEYFPATYYEAFDPGGTFSLDGQTFSCAAPSPAAYRALEADPITVSSVINPLGFHAFGPDGVCLRKVEIKPGNEALFSSGRSYDDEIQNFANWFQYSRKRHLALRAGFGAAFETITGLRVGGYTINARQTPTMWSVDAQRAQVYDFFYGIRGNSGGTPNREAVYHGGNQFDTNANIVQLACQQNFLLHFTDGFTGDNSYSAPSIANINGGNVDGTKGAPFADTFANTKADIAMHYYANGIRRTGTNALELGKVPVPAQCLSDNPPAWLDCNRDPHVNFYGITLGAEGDIFGVTHHTVRDAHSQPPTWLNPNAERSPIQVDDLYHAAVNGRGEMYDARSAEELKDRLGDALRGILSQVVGSQSSVAVNSTRLDTETTVFQARFNSAGWSGELLAFEINPNGTVGDQRWSAEDQLGTHVQRQIFVRNAAGATVPFVWDNLSSTRRTQLRDDPRIVDFLRGDRSRELANGGTFRNRNGKLGDIVHSSPVFDRATNSVYVGSNGGMLHAFDATTGAERFAFVPGNTDFSLLATLADENYQHRFFVDGEMAVSSREVTPDRSILVGAMGRGGRTMFAVDVTDDTPESLWEFTHPDLGFVTGAPIIALLPDGTPAAIFGNGYNSDNQRSHLFIVNLLTGAMIGGGNPAQPLLGGQPLAPTNVNGMATPKAWDVDANGRVDLVFAGDLQGNVWKFDLTASNSNNWGSAYTQGQTPLPLFVARNASGVRQPITSSVSVGLNPATYERWVFFGTGKYLEVADLVDTSVQSWYGIEDSGARITEPRATALRQREIIATATIDGRSVRAFSQPVPGDMVGKRGWYVDFAPPAEGERIVSDNFLVGRVLISASAIPTDDPCEQGGRGFINAVDAFTGGALASPFFDLNRDGQFDEGDMLLLPDESRVPAGSVDLGVGMPTTPAILRSVLVGSGSSGQLGSVPINDPTDVGRISWREIVRD